MTLISMEIYFYTASLGPSVAIIIFLLIEIIRRKLFFRAARKVFIMVIIIFVSTVASASVGVFINSAGDHTSENPGTGIIFLPVISGVLNGIFVATVFVVLKLVVKYARLLR